MRPNGSTRRTTSTPASAPSRVTSMARWLSRAPRRAAAPRAAALGRDAGLQRRGDARGVPHAALRVALSRLRDRSLVDDGSTDSSRAIAADFPVRDRARRGGRRRAGGGAQPRAPRTATRRHRCSSSTPTSWCGPTRWPLLADGVRARRRRRAVRRAGARRCGTRNLASQYKNLWMRWTYLRQTGDVPLFYTTAAAIRREAFLRVGGFDAGYATRTSRTRPSARSSRGSASASGSIPTSRSSTSRGTRSGRPAADRLHARGVARAAEAPTSATSIAQNNTSVPTGYIASVPLVGRRACCSWLGGSRSACRGMTAIGARWRGRSRGLNCAFLTAIRRSDGWVARAGPSCRSSGSSCSSPASGTAVGIATLSVRASVLDRTSQGDDIRWATWTTCSTARRCS